MDKKIRQEIITLDKQSEKMAKDLQEIREANENQCRPIQQARIETLRRLKCLLAEVNYDTLKPGDVVQCEKPVVFTGWNGSNMVCRVLKDGKPFGVSKIQYKYKHDLYAILIREKEEREKEND
jgi:hypothetical protein